MSSRRSPKGSFPSIPQIYATSITTAAFRWLHEEAWGDLEKLAFAELRQAPAAPIYAAPPLVKARKRSAPQTIGRWLLTPPLSPSGSTPTCTPDAPIAAAEVQLTQSHFTTITLLLSPLQNPNTSWRESTAKAALTLLISGLILLTQADQVRLIPLNSNIIPDLATLGFSQHGRDLWVPLNSLTMLGGGPNHTVLHSIDIEPGEWWSLAFAAADRSTLSYLEKRLDSLKTTAERGISRRRKHGLLQLFAGR